MKTSNLQQVNAPLLSGLIKAEAVEVHYQLDSDVVLHKAGCQHVDGADTVRPFDVDANAKFADDWYYVAPCAKKAS